MNVVSNVSFAFMFAYMLMCSCVAYRARPRKTGERYPVLPATIISLNACVSVVVALIHLVWVVQSPARFALSVYLAAANLFITFLLLEALLPKTLQAVPKYLVKRISGSGRGSVVVSEQDYQDRAIYDAHQLARKNKNAVFVVIDKHGNRIATINHSGVSVQMNRPIFGF